MIKYAKNKNGCIDVFKSFLVTNATYDTELEIPILKKELAIPNKLIPFSKAISAKDHNQWVHFYEYDYQFERIWRNPRRYLHILKKYSGVITPDFSLYRDMPLVMQYWNIYRSRAIGTWLQDNGIAVIPNIRFGDERTHSICCAGVEQGSTIALGTVGCLDSAINKEFLIKGLTYITTTLKPTNIVIYGSTPYTLFGKLIEEGYNVIQFDGDTSSVFSKKVGV